jgi:hypothetical protein
VQAESPWWWLTTDQDVALLAMHARHYSKREYADARHVFQCMGPGAKVPLRTHGDTVTTDAIWGWRKFIDDCIDVRDGERQQGINCAFFRNEGPARSSDLVRQADAIADCLWTDRRHYTYVDPKRVRSGLPGWCFLAAGWKYVRFKGHRVRTKSGLLILERVRTNDG